MLSCCYTGKTKKNKSNEDMKDKNSEDSDFTGEDTYTPTQEAEWVEDEAEQGQALNDRDVAPSILKMVSKTTKKCLRQRVRDGIFDDTPPENLEKLKRLKSSCESFATDRLTLFAAKA